MEIRKFLHDIVNPLTIIQGNFFRIKKKSDEMSKEDILERLEKASKELDRVFVLIKEMKEEAVKSE